MKKICIKIAVLEMSNEMIFHWVARGGNMPDLGTFL